MELEYLRWLYAAPLLTTFVSMFVVTFMVGMILEAVRRI